MVKNDNKSLMRKAVSAFLILTLLPLSVFAVAEFEIESNQVTVTYSFDIPLMEKLLIGGNLYDRVVLPGVSNAANPGEPCLPVKGAYILLPKDTRVDKISVEPNKMLYLGSGFNIEHAGKPIPLSMVKSAQFPEPDMEIYDSNDLFPGELFTEIGTYSFRGYDILVLELYPVQYVPNTGELYYYPDLTVYVETVEDGIDNILFRGLEKDELEIIKKIDNSDIIDTYIEKSSSEFSIDGSHDLLIITTNSLKDDFESLKEIHDAEGISTVIKTLSEIGCDSPEDIRDYIRDAYINLGIEYVLIGGDVDVVPVKMLWVFGLDEETTPYTTYMPSDLYYACLDGTYNYDGDEKWGEPTDGDYGGDVDLFAEIYIGRACVDNADEVNNFVDKTSSYIQSNNDEYLNEFLLVGERLGNYGIASWGGNYLDQLIDGSTDDGYTTLGIPSDKYNIRTLYDRDGTWSKSEIIDFINDGLHVINHDGHSNYNYNLKMTNADVVDKLTNEEYCFIYSHGCNAGGFDSSDCIAEHLTVKTECGAFAVIMNARYGWFWSFSTDGDSQRFSREFWDAVFGENVPVISKANQDSKEDNLYLIQRSCIRWCYYQLNLFGDPTLAFYHYRPNRPEKPSGHISGTADVEYTYSTCTTDPNDDQSYYNWDFGDGNLSDWIGPYNSGEEISVLHSWNEGSYIISVKARDVYGEESPWSEPLPISMPRNKQSNRLLLFQLLQRFPILEKIFVYRILP